MMRRGDWNHFEVGWDCISELGGIRASQGEVNCCGECLLEQEVPEGG